MAHARTLVAVALALFLLPPVSSPSAPARRDIVARSTSYEAWTLYFKGATDFKWMSLTFTPSTPGDLARGDSAEQGELVRLAAETNASAHPTTAVRSGP